MMPRERSIGSSTWRLMSSLTWVSTETVYFVTCHHPDIQAPGSRLQAHWPSRLKALVLVSETAIRLTFGGLCRCSELHALDLGLWKSCSSSSGGGRWSSGQDVWHGTERSRVRSPGSAKKWKHDCKYLPLLSCVLCYIMCLIVVPVCTIVNLRHWVSLAPRVCAKLCMLCYVHTMICVMQILCNPAFVLQYK